MAAPINEVEIVEFNERFCGRRKVVKGKPVAQKAQKHEKEPLSNDKIFNIKRARYEVMRFGLSGFDKGKQKQDKIAMAIRLGAKPPKREYMNYKDLMKQKLAEKEAKASHQTSQYTIQKLKGRKKNKPNKPKSQPKNLI